MNTSAEILTAPLYDKMQPLIEDAVRCLVIASIPIASDDRIDFTITGNMAETFNADSMPWYNVRIRLTGKTYDSGNTIQGVPVSSPTIFGNLIIQVHPGMSITGNGGMFDMVDEKYILTSDTADVGIATRYEKYNVFRSSNVFGSYEHVRAAIVDTVRNIYDDCVHKFISDTECGKYIH
jgi:hypothetical protein